MGGFVEASGKHHLEEGQGAAGKALQSNGMHFNPIVSELSVDDYPFVYHTWDFGLHAAVSFNLENNHMSRVDYVSEFFLPAETKEVSEHKLLIVGISSILQNCRNSWVISGMESSEDNMDSVVGSEGAIFDRSLPASSNSGSFNENGMIIASDAVNLAHHGIQIGVEAHEQVVFLIDSLSRNILDNAFELWLSVNVALSLPSRMLAFESKGTIVYICAPIIKT